MVVPDPSLLQPMKDDERKPSDLSNFTKIFDGIQEQLLRTKDKLRETEAKNEELQDKYEALKREVGSLYRNSGFSASVFNSNFFLQFASVEKENAILKREVASANDTVDDLKRVSMYAYETREEMKNEVQKQKEATRKVETALDRVRGEKDMLLRQSGILMENVAADKKLLRAVAENEDLHKKLLDFQAELTALVNCNLL